MIQGLRTVVYRVDDLERATAWYASAFEVEPYFAMPYYVGFRVGGCELGLDPDLSEGKPGPGGSVAYWGVDSIEAAVAKFLGQGASLVAPIKDVGDGIKVATVADPSGNEIGLIEQPAESSGDGQEPERRTPSLLGGRPPGTIRRSPGKS